MYLVVVMAFAFVLTGNLPPAQLNLFGEQSWHSATAYYGTLAISLGQVLAVGLAAILGGRRTLARLGPAPQAHDRAAAAFATSQNVITGMLAAALVATMLLTPWMPMVREGCRLGGVRLEELPLIGDLLILAPFFASLLLAWSVFYRVEQRLRAVMPQPAKTLPCSTQPAGDAATALAAAKHKRRSADSRLALYLLDKLRHQVLIIAVPMLMIMLVKYFTDRHDAAIRHATALPWAPDALLGLASLCVLAVAPLLLRYIWATEALPAGPLRDRFVRTCRRIGLRYREILLWHTHGTTVNAAVMGFVAPLRYILVSDALLETMDEDEIEAVFGHEAGHVRHWHLPYFGLFAAVSMYLSGGVILLVSAVGLLTSARDASLLQLVGLAVLLLVWLFGFGWLSRRFERQADLYGVRCVTGEIRSCVEACPIHGVTKSAGLCLAAANLFGRTLLKIADLNGIPRDVSSWRHGSIESRCQLIEEFACDASKLRRFERAIVWIKAALIAATLFGTAVAAVLYGPQIVHAVRSWLNK